LGSWVEKLALEYLEKQGAALIVQNFRCRSGEIDLIMKSHNTVLFIEVRFRKNPRFGTALESVHWQKRQKIIKTAGFFLRKFPNFYHLPCRFDILAARLSSGEVCFEWVQNAFPAF